MARLLVIALVAALAAGCGGKAREAVSTTSTVATTPTTPTLQPQAAAYVARMHRLGNRLGATTDGLYPLDTGTPGSPVTRATIAKLVRARVVVDAVAHDLGTVQPPAAISTEHRKLRAAVVKVSDQIGVLVKSLRKGDTATFNSFAQLPALRQVFTETGAMRRKGYDVVVGR